MSNGKPALVERASCRDCHGSGVCDRCQGLRDDPDWEPGDDPADRACFGCDGTGECDHCQSGQEVTE